MKKPSNIKEEDFIPLPTIQNFLPKLWAIFACEENEVHYLIKIPKKDFQAKWKTLKQIKDARDMVVFGHYISAKSIVDSFLEDRKMFPTKVDAFEICEVIPSYVDGGYWYEDITSKRIKVK